MAIRAFLLKIMSSKGKRGRDNIKREGQRFYVPSVKTNLNLILPLDYPKINSPAIQRTLEPKVPRTQLVYNQQLGVV